MKKVTILFLLAVLHLTFINKAGAQEVNHSDYPDSLNKNRLALVVGIKSSVFIGGIAYLQFVWYKDHERVPFHFYNDNAGWLQMDKAAHAYIAYHESEIGYTSLRWAGVNEKTALLIGGPLGLILQTPIEIFDGLYEGYGFSWGDMIANASGSALFTIQQALLNEQVARLKVSYSPSPYAQHYPPTLGETPLASLFVDYNGQTFWLSFPLQRITGYEKLPPWLSFSVGYSGNGMLREFENPLFWRGQPLPHFERYRQILFSADIDFTRIPTQSRALKTTFRYLNLLKFPAPAIEFNRIDGLKLRPLYY